MADNNPHHVVIAKALTDPAFKAELLKNPNAAVEKALGVKIPAGVTVKVVQDTGSDVHLVLPRASKNEQLSEGELGKVSGGAGMPSQYFGCRSCSDYQGC